ncbi:DUF2190 family protein [Brucella anthropi]|uniref:DUF2190 family protein n=1 Tax=Brucella anthropi (strain ATCC 49188 / DSM 6882 / CCUG 24695 / JCM 21032 / LMG 3331 / NBRC 15819 / NCTC 12168 / Alc 37) TaxID=439375 RepID=A6WZ16_BRUA4|nr:DUF2190 family protein [Brucella anthropi]ABS14220.1 conserved hypothetical protein [Brucella anthropi ATCC 49188]NKC48114.1 DUF2190 family protein [Brucella anthropi ATCC 49188]QQC25745.1 DUF2190 family protein [Brucella anthropi]RRY08810.1 DUF2190 family protein [Brucella anthropi]SUA65568.1 Uncharacterized conserved protein [Brucella anthropi]
MKNYIQPGDVLTLVAGAGGVKSGEIVVQGSIVAVAATSAVAGAEFEAKIGGVYEYAKNAAEAWTVGAPIYFDATNKVLTATAGENTLAGVAAAAAANPSGSGQVRLNSSFAA